MIDFSVTIKHESDDWEHTSGNFCTHLAHVQTPFVHSSLSKLARHDVLSLVADHSSTAPADSDSIRRTTCAFRLTVMITVVDALAAPARWPALNGATCGPMAASGASSDSMIHAGLRLSTNTSVRTLNSDLRTSAQAYTLDVQLTAYTAPQFRLSTDLSVQSELGCSLRFQDRLSNEQTIQKPLKPVWVVTSTSMIPLRAQVIYGSMLGVNSTVDQLLGSAMSVGVASSADASALPVMSTGGDEMLFLWMDPFGAAAISAVQPDASSPASFRRRLTASPLNGQATNVTFRLDVLEMRSRCIEGVSKQLMTSQMTVWDTRTSGVESDAVSSTISACQLWAVWLPSYSAVCGEDGRNCTQQRAKYRTLTMEFAMQPTRLDPLLATLTTPAPSGSTKRLLPGMGSPAGRVLCPPHCPGEPVDVGAPDAQASNTQGSLGLYYMRHCIGYEKGAVCLDPATAHLCAFGEDGANGTSPDCRRCAEGALCPGGYRTWPQPGYWVVDESVYEPKKCLPPNADRCQGWAVGTGRSACAVGHNVLSSACSECMPGYFEEYPNTCSKCPNDTSTLAQLPLLMPVAGVILVVYMAQVCVVVGLSRYYRRSATVAVPVLRSFTAAFLGSIAIMLQAGRNLSSNTPVWLSAPLKQLQVLMFDVEPVDPACTNGIPFLKELLILSLSVVIATTVLGSEVWRICGGKPHPRFAPAVTGVLPLLLDLTYPIVATYSLRLLTCTTGQIIESDGDRSTHVREAWVMASNSYQECLVGDHLGPGLAAIGALALHIIGWPLWSATTLLRQRASARAAFVTEMFEDAKATQANANNKRQSPGRTKRKASLASSVAACASSTRVAASQNVFSGTSACGFFIRKQFQPQYWYFYHINYSLVTGLAILLAVEDVEFIAQATTFAIAVIGLLVAIVLTAKLRPYSRFEVRSLSCLCQSLYSASECSCGCLSA